MRIWKELYKVIDSADVIIQVLDARDPMGTRSRRIEEELKTSERRHKHLVFILNKCDLVPTWVTRKYVKLLSQDYPTIAFHASITNSFGKGALIQLLRQFGVLHKDKKQISVGVVGYPNVGKSSIINTLRAKVVCPAAPIPGETKVWRYITLFKRIFLIDCPGVVYETNSEVDCVLKGVVRVDNLDSPMDFVPAILERVKHEYIIKTYGITDWKNDEDFLEKFAKKNGKLLQAGEPDIHNAAKMILQDWQRGKIPYFVPPGATIPMGNAKKSKTPKAVLQTVEQLFNKINVKTQFLSEDAKDPEDQVTTPLPITPTTKEIEVNEETKKEIGRAVQQECRDRSRMPSSA
eukprot:TRINITY_DN3098_c0_g1_i4.p1 TRINITY_DN3098_c0_g1~~TRINITY_DN3098_c0_g1_i4.p1  ORF type:complete len:361 (+),score=65.77 TRINITY_DN3098_c0_g1_i4:42-1085(+)